MYSAIKLARPDEFSLIYNHNDPSFGSKTSLSTLISDEFFKNSQIELKKASLSSNRYLSDFSFSKDATYFHNIKNSEDSTVEVITYDYFIEALKPYLHEITIF